MKRLFVLVFALLLIPQSGFAGAGKDGRFYLSVGGRFTVPEPVYIDDGSYHLFHDLNDKKLTLEPGFSFSAAAGWKFGNDWRGEIEYSRMSHDVGNLAGNLSGGNGFADAGASDEDRAKAREVVRGFCGELLQGTEKFSCGGRSKGGEITDHQGDRVSFDSSGILKDRSFQFLMVNAVRDFRNDTNWTPYLGFGVGVGLEEEAENTEFAYQFLVGTSVEAFDQTELILGYRFVGMSHLNYKYGDGNYSVSATFHNFEVGVRYLF